MKRRFRIGQMKNPQTQEPREHSPEWVAQHAKTAMNYLAPFVRTQHLKPVEALILVAGHMDYAITGKERGLTEKEIQMICIMVLATWRDGLFAPTSTYPYTYEQTIQAWNNLPKADESEVEA